jgi:hypothetical protein
MHNSDHSLEVVGIYELPSIVKIEADPFNENFIFVAHESALNIYNLFNANQAESLYNVLANQKNHIKSMRMIYWHSRKS